MRRLTCALALVLGLALLVTPAPALASEEAPEAAKQVAVDGTEGEDPSDEVASVQDCDGADGEDATTPDVEQEPEGIEPTVPAEMASSEVIEDIATEGDGTEEAEGLGEPSGEEPLEDATQGAVGQGGADADVADSDVAGAVAEPSSQAPAQQPAKAALAAQDAGDEAEAEEPVVRNRDVFTLAPSGAGSARVAVAGNCRASGANVELAAAKTLMGEYWRVAARGDGC